ncbi:MAG: glycine cleavage T C-terminal barrel domain-containing protein, partial [Pseudomonadota bacterium]|nr:glycine cleavage T C-terminal barrel domain-containing protein [Pseudomonadota bacterium]
AGPRLRRVSFAVEAEDADVMGDEPIWARVDTDYGTAEAPHGHGAARYLPDGSQAPRSEDIGNIRQGWRVVGWVTSGGYAHHVQLSMAQGYVPAALADRTGEGLFEIEILGRRRPARILVDPPFDPSGARMRG